jgi:hypothetical protein
MTNWDLTADKMPIGMVDKVTESKSEQPQKESRFQIDNEEIFVPVSDEFFVVL